MTIRAPASASTSAIARPIPWAPPVTMATCPSSGCAGRIPLPPVSDRPTLACACSRVTIFPPSACRAKAPENRRAVLRFSPHAVALDHPPWCVASAGIIYTARRPDAPRPNRCPVPMSYLFPVEVSAYGWMR